MEIAENRMTKYSREAFISSRCRIELRSITAYTGKKNPWANSAKSWVRVYMGKFEAKQLLKDKKFWLASFLIAWAAALQGHMMWLQRQDSFKQKFGTIDPGNDNDEQK